MKPVPFTQDMNGDYHSYSKTKEFVVTLRWFLFLFVGLYRRTVQRGWWNLLLIAPFLLHPFIGLAVILLDTFFTDYVLEKKDNFKGALRAP